MQRILTILTIVGLLVVLAAGCSRDDSAVTGADDLGGSDSYSDLDFDKTFGGLTATSEPAAFGDPGLVAELAVETEMEIDDPLASSPDVLGLEDLGRASVGLADSLRPRFTFVRLRWGMLRGPDDTLAIEPPCDVTDWTGELHTDRGLVVVRRLIAFERPFDHVIFPRLDAQTVALVSRTACGRDGVVIQIVERPGERELDAGDTPNRLHVNLGPFSASFNVADLGGLHEVTDVDVVGNRFEVTGFSPSDIDVCPKGFLSGRWRVAPADDSGDTAADRPDTLGGERLGSFAGVWRTLDGCVRGFLRGGYGLTSAGDRVFVGKYIGRRGEFRGLLRGIWTPGDEDGDLATFEGRWYAANGRVEGFLGGDAHPVADYPGGFFVGRWATDCDDDAVETVIAD